MNINGNGAQAAPRGGRVAPTRPAGAGAGPQLDGRGEDTLLHVHVLRVAADPLAPLQLVERGAPRRGPRGVPPVGWDAEGRPTSSMSATPPACHTHTHTQTPLFFLKPN